MEDRECRELISLGNLTSELSKMGEALWFPSSLQTTCSVAQRLKEEGCLGFGRCQFITYRLFANVNMDADIGWQVKLSRKYL
jgi:hypothetical protein